MKFLSKAEKSKDFWFILITSIFFFILRFPSLFEPYWYGDEGIYHVLGLGIRHGRVLYAGIWDNKPPLLYLIYGLFSSDQFYIRLFSLIFGILSTVVFFFLAKKLFYNGKEHSKAVYWSCGVFALLFALPLLEGNIANAENFMLLPILLAALIILKDKIKSSTLFLSGVLIGIAFLFKIVGIFDFAAFFAFLFILSLPRKIANFKKVVINSAVSLFPFILGFISLFVLTSLFFLGDAFKFFLQAVFVQNVGYVGYGNKFLIPQGLLIFKLVILSVFLFYLFIKRGNFTKTALFILIWFSFSLFNALFSQRPYTHYLLVLIPSLSLLVGLLIFEKKNQTIPLSLFVLSLFFIITNFNLYGKTPFYYQNFLSFILGRKSVSSYREFFDRKTSNDYEIAQYVNAKTRKNDQIFIWGNNAQVYKLTDRLPPGRYTVAYHITGFNDGYKNTEGALMKVKPRFIIIMDGQPVFPFSLSSYQPAMKIGRGSIYERIF
ncbi:MAG: hypothetical protein A2958_00860 [Candidatus Levybacteria bacterium RIFCSPLOWO2_01_FULL_38_13]|nr:MAG: hypothetical protein A2629_00755 [Candidatus Levybacteria bacterium RIFCSPHIGHO2_01_FULL_41_15]OGH34838.1 MAG: hypothetical protein A2958_00860 [Candidatus Levybacteria bacterium RIFCSPLOWO2_01_FULL_38_13]